MTQSLTKDLKKPGLDSSPCYKNLAPSNHLMAQSGLESSKK